MRIPGAGGAWCWPQSHGAGRGPPGYFTAPASQESAKLFLGSGEGWGGGWLLEVDLGLHAGTRRPQQGHRDKADPHSQPGILKHDWSHF